MGKARFEKLNYTNFRCCNGHEFGSEPDRVVDEPEWYWHPFRYFCACPECGVEAEQDSKYRGLLKAHAHATGPKTEEGKAASAANLLGHPTPTEALKTRFNAIQTGIYAEVATYYPAKPGKYPHCDGCSYYGSECVQNPGPSHSNPPACLVRVELFMKHHLAFESGDPTLLNGLRAGTQSSLQALIDDMILAITSTGVELRAPDWKVNPTTGKPVFATYKDTDSGEQVLIEKISAHPLLKILIEFISKNNLTLDDMGMTPKVVTEQGMMQGFLDDSKENRESASEYQQKLQKQGDHLLELITNSYNTGEKVIDGEVIEGG